MTTDWVRLGASLRDARKAARLTQEELAQRAGVSRATIQGIERGQTYAKIQPTHRTIARIVGWTEHSIDRVLEGGKPTTEGVSRPSADGASGPAAQPAATLRADLPLRIVQELEEGPLLDTQVMNLTRRGSSARMIVVVKGAPDASKEEIRQDLIAWRRALDVLEEGLEGDAVTDTDESGQDS